MRTPMTPVLLPQVSAVGDGFVHPAYRVWRVAWRQLWPAIATIGLCVGMQASAAAADRSAACVQFDTESLAIAVPLTACESTCDERGNGRIASPVNERLVEVVIGVSTMLRYGHEQQVRQLLFVIESPARTMSVVDFSPRTELTTSYAGNIDRTEQQDRSTSAGLNATLTPPVDFGTAQANASSGLKKSESVHFQSLPPMELLAASGTASRGSAVYFKFRSSPQSTLEGHRQLRVIFRVPSSWRGDYVYVRCAAFDQDGGKDRISPICGSSDFMVPLFLAGDDAARAAAIELGEAEYRLRQTARSTSIRIEDNDDPSWTDKVNRFLHVTKKPAPGVPRQWLSTVLTSQPEQRDFAFQERLPASVQQAVLKFAESRWQLAQLNQTQTLDAWKAVAKHEQP
ncbi:MAG: hypothetical protein KDA92_15805 [Planctomycetales bacterium]|nr:hypothetical protein [Planctomycetales bacterium]MCA9167860.1 hypothetical protein [Planctomycetales bacterium]